MIKYSINFGNLGNTKDRFLGEGYKEDKSLSQMFKLSSEIESLSGLEFTSGAELTASTVDEIGTLLDKYKLECASVTPDLTCQKRWSKGAISSIDERTREEAIKASYEAIDLCRKLGCTTLNVWPGQDGYDYHLQANYRKSRELLLDSLTKIGRYAGSDVMVSLEYKPKEPRNFSFLARACDTLLMANATGLENVGVTIDTGHAFIAGENVGETVAVLNMFGNKLFHMHFNDNYNSWDDDMVCGSVHFPLFIELLFWLRETGYSGWMSMDQYPFREDGKRALEASIKYLKRIDSLLTDKAMEDLRKIQKFNDALGVQQWMLDYFFK